MIKDNLQNILLNKYKDKSLASLYIANYDSKTVDPEIWVNNFLTSFSNVSDHPDILRINKASGENEYKVDSILFRHFFKFINYRPLQLKKKFIFIFDAQDISTILSNKLLKIFEELESSFCLILMVPDNSYILPTVSSRAIKLQIPSTNEKLDAQNDFTGVNSPQDLMAYLKQLRENGNTVQDEKQFIEQTIQHHLKLADASPEGFRKLEELLGVLADFMKYSNFNNSKLARFTRLFP
jgi:hypothetical protein